MKGLFIKDFYQLIKYCRMFFLIDLVFFAMPFFSEENIMFAFFPVLFTGMLPVTLLSYDERSGWSDYSGTLPYDEKQIVSEKYLLGLLTQALTAVLTAAVLFISGLVRHDNGFLANLPAIGVMFVISLVFLTLCMPLCYKFGTEKARVMYLILAAILSALSVGMVDKLTDGFGKILTNAPILPLILAVIIAAYIVSWFLSISFLKSTKR